MSDRLQGKTALLTAAAQGIGRATAIAREAAAIGPVDVRFNAAGYDHSGTVPVIDGGWSN